MPAGACAWARGMTPASRSAKPAPTMTRRAVRFIGHPPEFCGDAGNRPEPSGRGSPPSCRSSVSRATAITEGQPIGTPRRYGLSRAMSRSPTPPVFQGADLHRRQRSSVCDCAGAPRHASDLRHWQERDEVLERFRRGDIRTLVSARVLNEGLDVPDADILAIGAVLFAQRQRRAGLSLSEVLPPASNSGLWDTMPAVPSERSRRRRGRIRVLTCCSIAEDDMPSVGAEDLTAFVIALYEAAGTPPDHAQIVATHQAGANLVGHDSHGVVLLPTYIDRIGRGHIVPVARPEILNESPTTLAENGRWGFG